MTSISPPPGAASGFAFEPLLRIWMMPAQIGLEMMERSFAMMSGARPVARTEHVPQDIALAAEEQAAHIDDGHDTIVLPAALIA